MFLGKMQQNSKMITNGGRKSFSANYILGYHVISEGKRERERKKTIQNLGLDWLA